MKFNLKVQGYINEAEISQDEFLEQFQEWVSSKGWGFTGKVSEVTEEENIGDYIEMLASEKDGGIFSVYNDGEDEEEE